MVEFTAFAFGRVVVLGLGIAAIAALASPASARPLHRHHGHTVSHYGDHSASVRGAHRASRSAYRHQRAAKRHRAVRRAPQAATGGFAQPQQFGFDQGRHDQGQNYSLSYAQNQAQNFTPGGASTFSSNYSDGIHAPRVTKQRVSRRAVRARAMAQQTEPQQMQTQSWAGSGGGGNSSLVAEARRYIGGNPTGRSRLWCARFMNMVLERAGHRGTGSDMASSFARYGQRISGPQVGAIAVMSRGKRGGHVGIVSGIDSSGNPIVVSGNHGRRVAESVYSKSRIYAYVMPSS
ncbi:conserved hypothetical protein [Rhodopseudomonas palustris HaA2]|uniref:Peptidase C51 domain-containing protein n=1 Tax=Rhodopseudomonas palustris (strain HaA2) TaxID=316058 RepID=Q2IS72_RHOP2|nr:TIGR02594 family protein [Rhodopseudomonas palustris]ABD08938.1 conserved hypothetical protein [Rhodopseudomonas palustris HaA2]